MTQPITIGLVGSEPLVLTSSIWTLRCRIPVLPDGDGATWADLEERTARCGHKTTIIVGQAPTCFHHLVDAIEMLDVIHHENDRRPFPPRLHGPTFNSWPLIDCRKETHRAQANS